MAIKTNDDATFPVGAFEILTVRGRKSGQPIEIPIVVWPKDGNRII